MLKHVKGYKLSNKENKVVVKTFSGAKTSCMEHYIIPTIEQKPDVVILHCGTNDLKNQQPEEVCKNIINLGKQISKKSEETSVVVSSFLVISKKVKGIQMLTQKSLNNCTD